MLTAIALGLLALAFDTTAAIHYYPQSTVDKFQDPNINSDALTNEIFNLSDKIHVQNLPEMDTLAESCPTNATCTKQRTNLTYEEARKLMFGELFLEKLTNGKYSLKEVYCNITVNETAGIGPNKIPNPNILNCEHTWPQSKFSKKFPSDLQKTDLHHLFPTDMRANSTRNNFPFADVLGKSTHANCLDSKIGNTFDGSNIRSFEPPTEHKGNVARAIYYFSTRYKMTIDPVQAKYLKEWNVEDPVDTSEMERNDKIMQLQGNRNPFVDYPELINRIN
ncbi:MAG: endonuclease [Bdellovibrionales bacterium]|nr:endonuclease [Bdellovibrionales bacterium]